MKRRNADLHLRIADALQSALQQEADEQDVPVSVVVRRVLIEHAADRFERAMACEQGAV